MLTKELTKKEPKKSRLKRITEGLKEAAQTFNAIPAVVSPVEKLIVCVGSLM